MRRFSTLLGLLEARAAERPDQCLYRFQEGMDDDESTLSYGELLQRATRIAAALQAVTAQGERAVLLYPPGLEYIAGFFGCLASGVVAVPAYPPDPARLERTLPRLRAIIEDAKATVVLTTSFILSMGAPTASCRSWIRSSAYSSTGWPCASACEEGRPSGSCSDA